MTIEERLLSIRKHIGLTQAEFAKKFGLSSRAYASYELGERELPSNFILKLHEDLSINPTWLLSGQGPKTPNVRIQNILDAVEVADAFLLAKKIKLDPTRKARLILHLIDYFDEGGSENTSVAKQILENAK